MILLLTLLSRPTNESNFRTSAYEALASYVAHSAPASLPVVSNVIMTVLNRMEQLLGMQVRIFGFSRQFLFISFLLLQSELLGPDDRINWNDLQSNFSSVIIVRHRSCYVDFSLLISSAECRTEIRSRYSAPG
jgi:importin subunit beta-1